MSFSSSPNRSKHRVRPEPVHTMSLRNRGMESDSSHISPSKKPAKECSSEKKETVEECLSGGVNINETSLRDIGTKSDSSHLLSSKKKKPAKECLPEEKIPVKDGSYGGVNINETSLRDRGMKSEASHISSSKKKEPAKECLPEKKEPVKECLSGGVNINEINLRDIGMKSDGSHIPSSKKKKPARECLPEKKEPVKECLSGEVNINETSLRDMGMKSDASHISSSKKKKPARECLPEKKEPVKECPSGEVNINETSLRGRGMKSDASHISSSKKKKPAKECLPEKKEPVKECLSGEININETSLRDRGTKPDSSRISSSKKKKPARECLPEKKEPIKECLSGEINLTELVVEFLSPDEQLSARRILRKNIDKETTQAPIKVTHPDPLNGGNSSNINGSTMKDYGREPLQHTKNQPEKANGSASSHELRRKRKMAMPSGCTGIVIVDDLEPTKTATRGESQQVPNESLSHPKNHLDKDNVATSSHERKRKRKMAMPSDCNEVLMVADLEPNKTTTRVESQKDPCTPISHTRNQPEEANGTKSSYELRKRKIMCSGSSGKIIVADLESKEMATRVESQTIHRKKRINAEVISKNPIIPLTVRSLPLPDGDVAKGQESVIITVANDVNHEKLPYFHYIPRNAFFENAHVNVSLARVGDANCCANCEGNCLSMETPCVCSFETGCKFAYTTDGLVKEDFLNECISMNRDPEKQCKVFCDECPLKKSKNKDTTEPCEGHIVRKFIKECWLKCGCSQLCGNRVVQRGITRKLQIFMTPNGVGWGLRTLEDLPKGAFVCEYVGEVLTNAELSERNFVRKSKGEKHTYPVLLDADWCVEKVLDEEALCLDATHYGNVGRFINHRCDDSNMVEIPVEVDSPDHHYYHLAFFTTREVKALEELTWDYGIDFDDLDHPIKAFSCRCGSKTCRNTKSSSRNKNRSRSRRRRKGW